MSLSQTIPWASNHTFIKKLDSNKGPKSKQFSFKFFQSNKWHKKLKIMHKMWNKCIYRSKCTVLTLKLIDIIQRYQVILKLIEQLNWNKKQVSWLA